VHDIVRVNPADLRSVSGEHPAWVGDALLRAPFAVVRRCTSPAGMVSIGIRGAGRAQRWPAFCSQAGICALFRPEDLVHRRTPDVRLSESPALSALMLLRERWKSHSLEWGPTGSVGFELATGCLTATKSSDLDLVLRAEEPLSISCAAAMLSRANGLPAVADILVETPFCGFSLFEFVRERSHRILLRYPSAAILGDDPWRDPQERAVPA
jgi:phosphoribosyl-dephospho-CoA transferase